MAEGSSKALDDVKPPAEEEVILDFYEETLRGEPSIVVFSEGGFVIWICIFFSYRFPPPLVKFTSLDVLFKTRQEQIAICIFLYINKGKF